MELSPFQQRIILSKAHRKFICAARRIGKTHLGVLDVYNAASQNKIRTDGTFKQRDIVIMAKNGSQVKQVWLPMIKDVMRPYIKPGTAGINMADLVVTLKNEVKLHLKSGADDGSVDSCRGMAMWHFTGDECPFWRNFEYAWNSVILPSLADNNGTSTCMSSPNGKEAFYELCVKADSDDFPTWEYFHTDFTGAYYKEEVAKAAAQAKLTTDPVTYAREWLASFEGSGNSVYYSFNHKKNVIGTIKEAEPNELIRVGIDFNIGIMAAIVFVIRGGQMFVLDELSNYTNTEDLCKELKARYGNRRLICYPDPAGRQRKTSAAVGQTDFSIIESFKYSIMARKSTRSIIDGVNCVNALLSNADKEANLFIHPRCKNLINCLDRLVWKEDAQSAVYGNKELSHFADAIRYPVEYDFNLNKTIITKVNNPNIGF